MEKLNWSIEDIRRLSMPGYFTLLEYYKPHEKITESQEKELERIYELRRAWEKRKELTNLTG